MPNAKQEEKTLALSGQSSNVGQIQMCATSTSFAALLIPIYRRVLNPFSIHYRSDCLMPVCVVRVAICDALVNIHSKRRYTMRTTHAKMCMWHWTSRISNLRRRPDDPHAVLLSWPIIKRQSWMPYQEMNNNMQGDLHDDSTAQSKNMPNLKIWRCWSPKNTVFLVTIINESSKEFFPT